MVKHHVSESIIGKLTQKVRERLEKRLLRKAILQFIKRAYVHYTDLEKKAVATCLHFATSNTFRKQFYGYLLPSGYVERIGRGIYRIMPRGEKLLEILN